MSNASKAQISRPLKNAGIVGIGRMVRALLGLGSTVLAAKVLGVQSFGMLVLIHGFVFGLSQILRFQGWQAIIRFGASALEDNDVPRLQRLIKFTTILDWAAAIAGFLIIWFTIEPAGYLFNIPPEFHNIARLYGFAIIFMILTPTPQGILRLLDRFDLIAVQTTTAPTIRLMGCLWLYYTGGDLSDFLIVWFFGAVTERVCLQIMAWTVLKKQKLTKGFMAKKQNQLNPEEGIWPFIISHNISHALNASIPYAGLFFVGALLGPAAAGIYKVAVELANVLIKPVTKLLIPAIYPELARMQNAEDQNQRRQMVLKTAAIAASVALLLFMALALTAKFLITILFSAEFLGAYEPMLLIALAGLIMVLTFPLEPLLSAHGRVKFIMAGYAMGLLAYVIALSLLLPSLGLFGAGLASIVPAIISGIIMFAAGKDLIAKPLK